MERVYRGIVGWPKTTLLLVLVLTVYFAAWARHVRLDASVETLLAEGDAEKAYYAEIRDLFGSDEIGVVAILADDVYTPEVLTKIQRLTDEVAQVDGVAEVVSLTTAVDPVADVLDPPPLLPEIPQSPEALHELRQTLAARPIYVKNLVAEDGRAAGINVFFAEMSDEEFQRRGIDEKIQEIVDRAQGPERVVYTGLPHFKAHSARAMREDLRRFVPIALAIVVAVLLLCFRSGRGVLLPLVAIVVTLVWTLGIMVLADTPLSLGTIALPPLLLVLASAYCLHVVAEYYEAAEPGRRPDEIVLHVLRNLGAPILITALTTTLGFLSLVTNQIVSIRQLGIFASVGVAIAFLMSLVVVPAALALLPPPRSFRGAEFSPRLSRTLGAVAAFGIRRRVPIIATTVVLGLLGLSQIPKIQVDTNLQSFFREDDPVRIATDAINERLVGSMAFYVVIEADQPGAVKKLDTLERIRELQRYVDTLPGVDKTISFVDYAELLDRGSQSGGGAEGDIIVGPDGELIEAGAAEGGPKTTFWENPAQLEPVMQLVASSPKSFSRVVSPDFARTPILVRTTLARSSDIGALIARIEGFVARHFPPELRVHPTGNLILVTRTASDLVTGQIASLALATVVIFAVMALMFLSVRIGIIAMIPNLVPVLVFFGLMGITGATLNLGTSIIASIVLGIVVDDTIHLMSRLSAEVRATAEQEPAMIRTFSSVGKPALYTSAILFFGFLSLALSTFVPLQQFGALSAATILAALVAELALFPALLATTRIITLWDLLGVKLGKDPHRTIPLFAGLRPSQARLVALLAGLESHPAGAHVVRQGEVGDQMFVIIDGKAEVVVDAAGQRRKVRDLGRGDVFGEMGLIRSSQRTADIVATRPLEVMTMDEHALARLQRRYPRTAAKIFLNVAKILSDRLQAETARPGG